MSEAAADMLKAPNPWIDPHRLWTWLTVLLLLLAGCAPTGTSQSPTRAASLALTDCLLSLDGYSGQINARCGSLEVLENPQDAGGRKIRLNVAVVKARSSNPASDPVFLLAGGPGQAATQAYVPLINSLEKIRFKHDLVLIDQRGTGKSNPLACDAVQQDDLPMGRQTSPAQAAEAYRACLGQWDADPRYYTTAFFANDLEAVRAALGYGQIDLLGISYGTRAALAYLKAYPASVRAFVVDGVVPPAWVLGQSVDADAERAIQLLFTRCQAEPGCAAAFPDLRGDLDRLLARLHARPESVTIADPTSGKDLQVEVSDQTAAEMLRLITYSSDYSALIPVLIHTAALGDLRPLAAQYAISERHNPAIYGGLYYAVTCSEDAPFLPAQTPASGLYTFGAAEMLRAVCAVFPSSAQPQDERAFPLNNTPGLIISGEADPVTPPANGEAAARLLPNAKHIVLKGMGHSNVIDGCLPNLVRQLFEEGSSAKIDPACAQRVAPPPLFTSLIGPEP
jgi:pimeloyl-ACP methyl ester carboxylesterase